MPEDHSNLLFYVAENSFLQLFFYSMKVLAISLLRIKFLHIYIVYACCLIANVLLIKLVFSSFILQCKGYKPTGVSLARNLVHFSRGRGVTPTGDLVYMCL